MEFTKYHCCALIIKIYAWWWNKGTMTWAQDINILIALTELIKY